MCCGCQSAEVMRRRKLRLNRLSEALRRDEALSTTRQRLRPTEHCTLINDRLRRAFQQLCDQVRLERLRQRCLDVQLDSQKSSTEFQTSSERCSADVTRVDCVDDGLAAAVAGSSSCSVAATTTTTIHRTTNASSVQHTSPPTSTEVASPAFSVALCVSTTSNSMSGTPLLIVSCSAALCLTSNDATTATTSEDSCVPTFAVNQSCVSVWSAGCGLRASSDLRSADAVRGRVTFNERQTENPTTKGSSNDNDDNDHDHHDEVLQNSSSVEQASTISTHPVISTHVDESSNDQCSSSTIEYLSAVPQTHNNNNNKDNIIKVGDVTSSAPHVGIIIKENGPPVTALVNGVDGVAQSPHHATASQRANRPQTAVKQRAGCSDKWVPLTSSSDRNSTASPGVGRVPPPVPTRTSSSLTRGGTASRSIISASVRPSSWQAKANVHPPGNESLRATPPPMHRSAVSAQPKSTINNGISRPSAFKRDRTSPATTVIQEVTETEII